MIILLNNMKVGTSVPEPAAPHRQCILDFKIFKIVKLHAR